MAPKRMQYQSAAAHVTCEFDKRVDMTSKVWSDQRNGLASSSSEINMHGNKAARGRAHLAWRC